MYLFNFVNCKFVTECFKKSEYRINLPAAHWGLSLFDRGQALAVTPDGLRCQSREQKEWHGCRANKGVSGSGKYFFEAAVTDEGLCRVGWSTSQASIFAVTHNYHNCKLFATRNNEEKWKRSHEYFYSWNTGCLRSRNG